MKSADLFLPNPTLGCTCLASGWAQTGGVRPGVSQPRGGGGDIGQTEEALPSWEEAQE